MKFKIKEIVHSGRKGTRYDPVTDEKYDGLIGCNVKWNIKDIRQFDGTTFKFQNHPFYNYWHTSPVIQLSKRDFTVYELETVNTIYILEEVE